MRAWARQVVLGTTLDDKLRPPPAASAGEPAPPEWIAAPGRPADLQMRPGREVVVPPVAGVRDPAQRARILHALANHELQAAELFAWALLAFADQPRAFRTGLAAICADEQRHCAAYAARAAALGCRFGDCPVTGHFWNKLDRLATPLGFVCTMGLTFENANLDFTAEYAAAARAAGDAETAAILDEVAADEVDHVRFAWTWLGRLAPGEPPAEVYARIATAPLGWHRARGAHLDVDARRRAGLDDDFIARLDAADPLRPGGGPRALILVGNLDCEVAWAGGPPLPPAVTARLALLATTLRVYARDDDDVLWLPAPVDRAQVPAAGAPRPVLATGPIPDGPRRPWGALAGDDVAIARAVNDRRFAAALAAELGVALPGTRVITSVDEIRAHLAAGGASASPTGAWVAKAPLTAAGRDRVRRHGDALDPPTATRVARLLARTGALVFEPWMTRTLDVGQGGTVVERDRTVLVPPHRARCDAAGVIRGLVVDDGAALEPAERATLAATALAVGHRLGAAGYRGPFVVDAFVHEVAGARRLHPLVEVNARLTFGLVARAWAERRGHAIILGLDDAPPPGAEPLVHAGDGTPAAWIAPLTS